MRRRLSTLLALAALLSCQDGSPTPPEEPRPAAGDVVGLVLSSETARPGDVLFVGLSTPRPDRLAGLQGVLRFDPTRLAFVGQVPRPGQLALIQDADAEDGELRLLTVGIGGPLDLSGTVLSFRVLRGGYAGTLHLRDPLAAGRDGEAWEDPTAGPPALDPGLTTAGVPRRMDRDDWEAWVGADAPPVAAVPPAGGYRIGDCSFDGLLNVLDVLATARISVGMDPGPGDPGEFTVCDVRIDGTLNVLDVLQVGSASVGNGGPTLVGAAYRPLALGGRHACALNLLGAAYCWGANDAGQLGTGSTLPSTTRQRTAGVHAFIQISAGERHTCALDRERRILCWGENGAGQVGAGLGVPGTDAVVPTLVSGSADFVGVAAGGFHTCGLTSAGAALCWGSNEWGQLGSGSSVAASSVPLAVAGGHVFVQLTAGEGHTCGRTVGGGLLCWGFNGLGQLGTGTTTDRSIPAPVAGLSGALDVTAGGGHTCALDSTGRARCWGGNAHGQLGDGTPGSEHLLPTPVAGDQAFVTVTAGPTHTCGLDPLGRARCWGGDVHGGIGDGVGSPSLCGGEPCAPTPREVTSAAVLVSLEAGSDFTCGVDDTGAGHCWGLGSSGQVGTGGTPASLDGPTPIVGNAPPQVTILSPLDGTSFGGGDSLVVLLSATDPEDGSLSGTSVTWWSILHHDTHTHPFVNPLTGTQGLVVVPRSGHVETDIFYRIHARAVDSEGRADTVFVDLPPRVFALEFVTEPAGLQVVVDGQPRTTPVTLGTVEGIERTLDVFSPQNLGAFAYRFGAWSIGGDSARVLVAPGNDLRITATFQFAGAANAPPTVSVTSPASGSVVTVGVPTPVTAAVGDVDGLVTRVEFFDGTTLVGLDTSAPFSVQWTPPATGPRSLTARATDDDGALTTSAAVSVTVQAQGGGDVVAPTATLTSPAQGAPGLVGSVFLAASASDNVGVVRVEFQVDGETLAVDTTPPWSAQLPSTAAFTSGAHTIRARAQDAAGNWSPWSTRSVTFGGTVDLPAGFVRSSFAQGFGSVLTSAAFAPDGRLFLTELTGRVRIVKNGSLLPTPFATIPVLDGGERGLLGLALDPAFTSNGHIFLYYTTPQGSNRISRFTASGDGVVPGSEVVLADLPVLSAPFHQGGAMHVGPDGKLYVAVGDGTQTSMPQSLSSPLGKILRLNRDGSIPTDNPFYGQTRGFNRGSWVRGIRNPYTFAFQPGTGRMHINAVGEGAWEEINLGVAGSNYGWPLTEGPTTNPAYRSPILAYGHFDSPTLFTGASIVGAAFYNPAVNTFGSAYTGDFFFADYVEGWIYRMESDGWDTAYAFARLDRSPVNLLVGPDGALYVLAGDRVDRISR